jgi:hypothetical protein
MTVHEDGAAVALPTNIRNATTSACRIDIQHTSSAFGDVDIDDHTFGTYPL